jgi:hypothetical protein
MPKRKSLLLAATLAALALCGCQKPEPEVKTVPPPQNQPGGLQPMAPGSVSAPMGSSRSLPPPPPIPK